MLTTWDYTNNYTFFHSLVNISYMSLSPRARCLPWNIHTFYLLTPQFPGVVIYHNKSDDVAARTFQMVTYLLLSNMWHIAIFVISILNSWLHMVCVSRVTITIDDLSMLGKFFILYRPCTLLGYPGQRCTVVILNGRDMRACHRGSCTGNEVNANYERIASWVGAWFRIHNLDTRGMLNVHLYRYVTSQWRPIVRFLTYLD